MVGLKMCYMGGAAVSARSWWPSGSVFAADFTRNRYMRSGSHASAGSALTFARASEGWATDSNGTVHSFAANEMRRTGRGLRFDGPRTRLSLAPIALGSAHWIGQGAIVLSTLPPDGSFSAPARIASDGTAYARRISALISLDGGETVRIKIRYRAGTSSRFGFYVQTGATTSLLEGPVGNLAPNTSSAGSWAAVTNVSLPDGSQEIEADFTAATTAANYQLGVSPRSNVSGEYVDVLGAMVVGGGGATDWIFGDPAAPFTRLAEEMTLHLPEGTDNATFTFADAPDQTLPANGDWVAHPAAMFGRTLMTISAG